MSSKHMLYGDAKASATGVDNGRKQKALAAAQERLAADPSAANRLALADAMADLGRYAESEQLLKQVLQTEDSNPDILFDLGFVYKNLGRKDEAITAWKQLVAANPKHPLARGAENEIWRLDPTYRPSWMAK